MRVASWAAVIDAPCSGEYGAQLDQVDPVRLLCTATRAAFRYSLAASGGGRGSGGLGGGGVDGDASRGREQRGEEQGQGPATHAATVPHKPRRAP